MERLVKHVGIIGAEAAKWPDERHNEVRVVIHDIMLKCWLDNDSTPFILVSGHCHLGGADMWAEDEAKLLDWAYDSKYIFEPKQLQWDAPYGFKKRNLDIAKFSDELHVVVAKDYPTDFEGMKFPNCYHCAKVGRPTKHLKSGACWTANEFVRIHSKEPIYHII